MDTRLISLATTGLHILLIVLNMSGSSTFPTPVNHSDNNPFLNINDLGNGTCAGWTKLPFISFLEATHGNVLQRILQFIRLSETISPNETMINDFELILKENAEIYETKVMTGYLDCFYSRHVFVDVFECNGTQGTMYSQDVTIETGFNKTPYIDSQHTQSQVEMSEYVQKNSTHLEVNVMAYHMFNSTITAYENATDFTPSSEFILSESPIATSEEINQWSHDIESEGPSLEEGTWISVSDLGGNISTIWQLHCHGGTKLVFSTVTVTWASPSCKTYVYLYLM